VTGARLVRALAGFAIALAAGVVVLPAAAAHSSQTGSTPAEGAVLDVPPSFVEVTFDTALMDMGAALVVRSEDGTVISAAAPEVGRTAIRIAVATDAPPGAYTVAYRVVSQDGHPITATFDYTVAGDMPASAAAAPAPDEGPDGPPYALIAAGLLVLTLIVAGAIALR
jgi:copper resistance protein C